MFNSVVNGFKKSIRAPILHGVREIGLYRQLFGLPTNQVIGIESYFQSVHQANGQQQFKQSLDFIHPSAIVPIKPALNRQGVPELLRSTKEFTTPATFVARLANQQLFGKGIAIITPDKRILSEVTVHLGGNISAHSVLQRFHLPRLKTVKGTTAILSAPAGNVFYHWLFDLLPRIELMRLAGVDFSRIDNFAINSNRSRFQRDTLAMLNIDPSRILETDRHRNILCEEMILPSYPGYSMTQPKWVCDFLAKTILAKEPAEEVPQRKRIYITRKKSPSRYVINQDEIDALVTKHGFNIVAPEDYDLPTQARIFNQAEVIVAPRGSGLSNLVFCKPGTIVVELFTPSQLDTCFWILCSQMGLPYYCQVGFEPSPKNYDYIVNVNSLSDLFKEIGL